MVKTKRSFQALAEFLLGNLLLVNDLKEAIKGTNLAGWNTVDLSGDYFGKNMILWTPDKSGKGVVGRREKIEHLQREIDVLGKKAESLKNKILFIIPTFYLIQIFMWNLKECRYILCPYCICICGCSSAEIILDKKQKLLLK